MAVPLPALLSVLVQAARLAHGVTQLKLLLFRYVAVSLTAGELPDKLTFSAWGVKYEYDPSDSSFVSSDAMLNSVHELARWTLDGGVLDTYAYPPPLFVLPALTLEKDSRTLLCLLLHSVPFDEESRTPTCQLNGIGLTAAVTSGACGLYAVMRASPCRRFSVCLCASAMLAHMPH